MNIDVIRKLVDRGIIHENTEITANYLGKDIAGNKTAKCKGDFFIKAIKFFPPNMLYFDALSTVDGSLYKIYSTQVEGIDGMPLNNLAASYGINPTGGKIVEGKRRGRKPKIIQEVN